MRRFLLILICLSGFGVAETNSLDISISDMKEAIYRLIKDMNEIKAVEGSKARKEIEALKRKVSELEKQQQKMIANQKATGNINKKRSLSDSFIDAFVRRNSKTSIK